MALQEIVSYADVVTQVITLYVVTPLLIFFAAVALGRVVRNFLRTILSSVELDVHVQKITGQPVPAVELISGVVAALIYAAGTLWALHAATILDESLRVVGFVLVTLLLLACILGLRDFLPNYFAGRKQRKTLVLGGALSVQGVRGEVETIGLLSVQLRTADGDLVAIPYQALK